MRILGIYDKETYIKKNITYTKYWTSDDGEMNVYYRNNINLERGSLFPFSEEYKKKKNIQFLCKIILIFLLSLALNLVYFL